MKELLKERIEVYRKELESITDKEEYARHIAVIDELLYILSKLEPQDTRRYETYHKGENGKYYFNGWYQMCDEKFCIETKVRGKYTYKTYKWLDGKIDEYRYGSYVED